MINECHIWEHRTVIADEVLNHVKMHHLIWLISQVFRLPQSSVWIVSKQSGISGSSIIVDQ